MKQRNILILLSILLTLACLFASCNANKPIFPEESITTDTDDYTKNIQALENKILELQQNHQVSEEERQQEITRLQALLAQLKKENGENTTPSDKAPSQGTTSPSGKYLYNLDGEFAIITGYTGTEDRLVIPSMIDGYTVREIADNAFTSKQLKTLIITNGITKIGWFSFQECSALTSVTLPESIESIGYSAFPTQNKNFSICCSNNSFAQQYAKSYGISYTII